MLLKARAHEYAVLYSTRIDQKEKHWRDGYIRFYEYNGKLVLVNENDVVIALDFFSSKTNAHVLEHILLDGKVFKLPTNPLLVHVLEKTRVMEPDFEDSQSGKVIGREKGNDHQSDSASLSPSAKLNHIKRAILTPKVKHPEMKPQSKRVVPKPHPQRPTLKLQINQPPHSVTDVASQALGLHVDNIVSSYTVKRRPGRIRIPPKSSSCFKYLRCEKILQNYDYSPPKHENKGVLPSARIDSVLPQNKLYSECEDPRIVLHPKREEPDTDLANNYKGPHPSDVQQPLINRDKNPQSDTLHEPQSITIKKEPTIYSTSKGTDDPDIIYDLSDYEQDKQFYELVRSRQLKDSEATNEEELETYSDFSDMFSD